MTVRGEARDPAQGPSVATREPAQSEWADLAPRIEETSVATAEQAVEETQTEEPLDGTADGGVAPLAATERQSAKKQIQLGFSGLEDPLRIEVPGKTAAGKDLLTDQIEIACLMSPRRSLQKM